MKLLFVFGTRPEAIKMAPVIRAAKNTPGLDVRSCVTGQHREMLDQVLRFFCICPDHDLAAMQQNQDLSSLTTRVLDGLRPVLLAERPDMVLVQGDTVSALAGALGAFFERIRVGHIEAGLRTHDLQSPFPEEAIRQMVSRLASLHFAPTEMNVEALLKEGVPRRAVFLTGNPVVDSVLWTRDRIRSSRMDPLSEVIDRDALREIERASHVILVTGHRRENFGIGLREICGAVAAIALERPDAAIVFPVHPNPTVREQVYNSLQNAKNVFLLPPLEYPAFVHLMDKSTLILSDSGGVQEEAPALGKPVLVTRATTERMEAVDTGAVRIVGTSRRNIVRAVNEVLDAAEQGRILMPPTTPFGDGHAAEKIVDIIRQQAELAHRPSLPLPAAGNWPGRLEFEVEQDTGRLSPIA
ncbi:MAG: UDP-N-acetylglucosamine 2-epimerase (non-hydrolyzing) [Bryobacteraceae bacterium]